MAVSREVRSSEYCSTWTGVSCASTSMTNGRDHPSPWGAPVQGPSAALYPAFSLNRNVQLTIHTALDPPQSSDDSDDAADDGEEPPHDPLQPDPLPPVARNATPNLPPPVV
ncbi:hypothetical protein MTO96_045449 [Rhipicephalus appendiculatus]